MAGGGGDCGPWSAGGVGEGGALMAGTLDGDDGGGLTPLFREANGVASLFLLL